MNGQTGEHRKQAINTVLQKFAGGARLSSSKEGLFSPLKLKPNAFRLSVFEMVGIPIILIKRRLDSITFSTSDHFP